MNPFRRPDRRRKIVVRELPSFTREHLLGPGERTIAAEYRERDGIRYLYLVVEAPVLAKDRLPEGRGFYADPRPVMGTLSRKRAADGRLEW